MRPTPTLAALLLCAAGPASAQRFEHWLEPGTRVRVTAPALGPSRPTGEVAALLPDTLVLARRGDDRLAIPNLRIDLIEVSQGLDRRRGAWKGAMLGALVGAGIGGIFGALGSQHLPTDVAASAGLGFVGGGLLGGGVGAGTGALFAPERWQPYRIEHDAAPRRYGGTPASPPRRP